MLKVHLISETPTLGKGTGVHTAFVDMVELLREENDMEVVVNDEGTGDVFHAHTYGPYYFWKGLRYAGRRIFTVHVIPDSIKGTLPFWKIWYPFTKWYLKKVYAYADVNIAISPMVAKAIKDSGADTRVVCIPNPIPLDRWKSTAEKRMQGRKLLGIVPNEFVVLGVGQLQGRKGVEDFVEVARAIPEAKFVWAGGRPFGAMTDGVSRINSLITNAPSNVHFAGMFELEDMPKIYAAGDMMLFPSYQENCPMAPLEAAACGMPVVFRNLKEYEMLYESPYLKGANNSDFIRIIQNAMLDEDFYENGKNMSARLIRQFDKNEVRRKLKALYQELDSVQHLRQPTLTGSWMFSGR